MATQNVKREIPIAIRFSLEEHQMLKEAAAAEYGYISAYVRRVVLTETEKRVKQAEAGAMEQASQ